MSERVSVLGRLMGGIVCGGLLYGGFVLFVPTLSPQLVLAGTGVGAVIGLAYGPKAWEIFMHLF